MSKRLSNFQIDDFFKDEENEDLNNNYMETYSIDSITKYISFYEIIKKRNAKYPFAIQIIQIKKLNLAFTCGFLWMFIQKIICFCLIRLVSKDLSFLLQIMMKTRSTNYFKILKVDQVKN